MDVVRTELALDVICTRAHTTDMQCRVKWWHGTSAVGRTLSRYPDSVDSVAQCEIYHSTCNNVHG